MPEPDISLKFKLNSREERRLRLYARILSPIHTVFAVVGIAAAAALLTIYTFPNSNFFGSFRNANVALLGFLAFYFLLDPLWWIARPRSALGPIEIRIHSDGLLVSNNEIGIQKIPWHAVSPVREFETGYVIRVDSDFLLIPKRVFESDNERELFFKLFVQYTGKSLNESDNEV